VRLTDTYRYGRAVAIGCDQAVGRAVRALGGVAKALAGRGSGLTVLPATDLYLMGGI